MKNAIPLLLMIAVLLTGCSGAGADTEKFMEFRDMTGTAADVSARAEITADFGEKVQIYTVEYTQGGSGARIEILEPELLRGIVAVIDGPDSQLEYDGLILDTGELNGRGLTPVSALPSILDSILNGHLESCWREKDGDAEQLVFDLSVTDESNMNIWIDGASLTPRRAEIRSGGRVVITCVFSQWNIGS